MDANTAPVAEIEDFGVSIHAPVMDANLPLLILDRLLTVSIHAPVMDANALS